MRDGVAHGYFEPRLHGREGFRGSLCSCASERSVNVSSRLVFLLLLAACLTPSESNAQQLAIGTRAGFNIAGADAKGSLFDPDVGMRAGFHGGFLVSVDVTSHVALHTEILFTRKGFGKGDGEVALKVDYVEFPVLLVIKLPGTVSPHLNLGPYLGLEASCTASTATVDDTPCSEISTGPATRGADSGFVVGGGVTFDVGFASLLLDAYYNIGLTDVSEITTGVESIKTRTLYLSAGLTRILGRGN